MFSTLSTIVAAKAGVQLFTEYCEPVIKREVRRLKARHSDDFVIAAIDWFVNVDEPKGPYEKKAKKYYNYN